MPRERRSSGALEQRCPCPRLLAGAQQLEVDARAEVDPGFGRRIDIDIAEASIAARITLEFAFAQTFSPSYRGSHQPPCGRYRRSGITCDANHSLGLEQG